MGLRVVIKSEQEILDMLYKLLNLFNLVDVMRQYC